VTAEHRGGDVTPDGRSDEAHLVRRATAGDAAAFRTLVDRHVAGVVAVARRILADEAEAEDVAQDVMLRLWHAGAGLEIGEAGLKPWLRRVATNLAIDRFRSRRRTDLTDQVPETPEDPDQDRGLMEGELSERVEQALIKLPERQRRALSLFHFEGLSQTEVAAALGVSDEAVESLLARARRSLKATFKDEWRDLLPDGKA
jgi:RNA polymerase sigma-70 factor (ECF subfamily)